MDGGKIQRATQQQVQRQEPQQKISLNQSIAKFLDGEKLRGRFEELLGKRTPQFLSGIVSLINSDAKLMKAWAESPMTVAQACLQAATFDLPIDRNLGYAWILPFDKNWKDENGQWHTKTEASFILGWKGMHQLAMRTGVYKVINVKDIRQGELVSFNPLTEESEFRFVEDEDERDSLPIVGYAGYYRLINGSEKTVYMSRKAVEAHELRNRKGKSMTKGWRENFDAMALKTVYRQLIGKWGVMSIDYRSSSEAQQIATDLSRQMAAEDNMDDLSIIEDDTPQEAAPVTVDDSTGEIIDGQQTL